MEKTTVLFRLRYTVALTDAALDWLKSLDVDFSEKGGNAFLREFSGTWSHVFESVVNEEVRTYFKHLDLPDEYMPFVQRGETYIGSWVMEASVVMRGTMGRAYNALRRASDLSSVAEGFVSLKDEIIRKLDFETNENVRSNLLLVSSNAVEDRVRQISPPARSAVVDLVIDARPLTSLVPAAMKSHKVHLSVAISRDTFTLENLDTEPMRDVRIGLFKSPVQRNQWNYAESYMATFPLISGHQTIAKNLSEFQEIARQRFDLSDGQPVYVDCWISDSHGICLFHFFLEN